MEDFDTTTPEKTESERLAETVAALDRLLAEALQRLNRLEVEVADLQSRKNWQGHQEENDDPEWYA